jgi:hypothetical protein
MMRKRAATAAILVAVMALGACQTARFGGSGPVASAGPVYNTPEMMEEVPAAPSGAVTAEPLPPPGGDPYGAGPYGSGPVADAAAAGCRHERRALGQDRRLDGARRDRGHVPRAAVEFAGA